MKSFLIKFAASILITLLYVLVVTIGQIFINKDHNGKLLFLAIMVFIITTTYGIVSSYVIDYITTFFPLEQRRLALLLHVFAGSLFFFVWLYPIRPRNELVLDYNQQMFQLLFQGAFISLNYYLMTTLLAGKKQKKYVFAIVYFLLSLLILIVPYLDNKAEKSIETVSYIIWLLVLFGVSVLFERLPKKLRNASVILTAVFLLMFGVHQILISLLEKEYVFPRKVVTQIYERATSLDSNFSFQYSESRSGTLKYSNIALLRFTKKNEEISKEDIDYVLKWIPETSKSYSITIEDGNKTSSVFLYVKPSKAIEMCRITNGNTKTNCSSIGIDAMMN